MKSRYSINQWGTCQIRLWYIGIFLLIVPFESLKANSIVIPLRGSTIGIGSTFWVSKNQMSFPILNDAVPKWATMIFYKISGQISESSFKIIQRNKLEVVIADFMVQFTTTKNILRRKLATFFCLFKLKAFEEYENVFHPPTKNLVYEKSISFDKSNGFRILKVSNY